MQHVHFHSGANPWIYKPLNLHPANNKFMKIVWFIERIWIQQVGLQTPCPFFEMLSRAPANQHHQLENRSLHWYVIPGSKLQRCDNGLPTRKQLPLPFLDNPTTLGSESQPSSACAARWPAIQISILLQTLQADARWLRFLGNCTTDWNWNSRGNDDHARLKEIRVSMLGLAW